MGCNHPSYRWLSKKDATAECVSCGEELFIEKGLSKQAAYVLRTWGTSVNGITKETIAELRANGFIADAEPWLTLDKKTLKPTPNKPIIVLTAAGKKQRRKLLAGGKG